MDGFFDLSWRGYPATALMLLGAWLWLVGMRDMVARWPRLHAADRHAALLVGAQGFRLVIVGLALFSIGLAWITQQLWLLVLALGIGGEELLESSVIIAVLRRRPPAAPAARNTPAGP